MALPSSGPISLLQIATEFGGSAPHSLNEYYGKAAGIPASGTISLANFYGKSNTFTLNITTSVASPNIHALAISAGWSGTSSLIVNFNCPLVNSLRLDGSKTFPGGLALNISASCRIGGVINSGTAFYTRVAVTVNNSGIISGGGGKGGDGQRPYVRYSTDPTNVIGGAGAGAAGQGFASTASLTVNAAGFGFSGSTSTYSGEVIGTAPWATGGVGGNGGAWGTAGATGSAGTYGGNYSTSGIWTAATAGTAAGLYVDGNSFVTWTAIGTRVGGVA